MNTFSSKLEANPMIGRRVLYMLNKGDADEINRSRAAARTLAVSPGDIPLDVEEAKRYTARREYEALRSLRTGNGASEGQILPAFIVTQWTGSANLQVLLDGIDTYWATSRNEYRGDESPEFNATIYFWPGGRWHFVQRGPVLEDGSFGADVDMDQTQIVKLLDASGGDWRGDSPLATVLWLQTEHDITISWEPDARGMWIYAD